jgi:hypothetical protein
MWNACFRSSMAGGVEFGAEAGGGVGEGDGVHDAGDLAQAGEELLQVLLDRHVAEADVEGVLLRVGHLLAAVEEDLLQPLVLDGVDDLAATALDGLADGIGDRVAVEQAHHDVGLAGVNHGVPQFLAVSLRLT